MVSDVAVAFPETDTFQRDLEDLIGVERVHWVDASDVTTRLLGDSSTANVFLIGIAFQIGALPISSASLEAAIGMNGVAVDRNVAAFRAGRWWIADRGRLGLSEEAPDQPPEPRFFDQDELPSDLHLLAERRAADLVEYQDRRYAQVYIDLARRTARAEARIVGAPGPLTYAVVRNLYKLMA